MISASSDRAALGLGRQPSRHRPRPREGSGLRSLSLKRVWRDQKRHATVVAVHGDECPSPEQVRQSPKSREKAFKCAWTVEASCRPIIRRPPQCSREAPHLVGLVLMSQTPPSWRVIPRTSSPSGPSQRLAFTRFMVNASALRWSSDALNAPPGVPLPKRAIRCGCPWACWGGKHPSFLPSSKRNVLFKRKSLPLATGSRDMCTQEVPIWQIKINFTYKDMVGI